MSAERSAGASATAADPSEGFDPDTFFCGDGPPSELGGTEAPQAAPSSAPVQSQWVGPVADLLAKGARAASDGRMPEALSLFTQAARKCPSCAAAHEQRAQVLLELDQYDEAVTSAREACAADPRWGVGRLTLGRACLNAGLFGEARLEFDAALRLDRSLLVDVADDLERAMRLQLEQDERTLTVRGAELTLRQWRDGTPAAGAPSGAPGCNCGRMRDGTGTMMWEAGVVLAKYLELVATFRRARVIELGAGTGVLGLAAAAMGADVLLTDVADVVPTLAFNVDRNRASVEAKGGRARAAALDWTDCAALPDGAAGCSWVLGADLVFNEAQLLALAPLLPRLMMPITPGAAPAQLVLAHKARRDTAEPHPKRARDLDRRGTALRRRATPHSTGRSSTRSALLASNCPRSRSRITTRCTARRTSASTWALSVPRCWCGTRCRTWARLRRS